MTRSYCFMFVIVLACFIAMSPAGKVAAADAPQTTVTPPSKTEIGSPAVVIYTLSTCPHCAEAKAYLTKEGIPFTNREVDTDDEHMAELVEIYDDMKVPDEKRGVPLFIIGGKTRLQGFDREKIKAALKEAARN